MAAVKQITIFCFMFGINFLMATGSVPSFNDPKFQQQFYLSERYGVTMNIHKAWNRGLTGRGVTICISDPTGVEKDHSEFASKFILQGSYDYKTNTSDPSPNTGGITDGVDAHGTKMAGLAAAKANNGICGVGVAYDASLSGIKLIVADPLATSSKDSFEQTRFADTLKYRNDINHIYSCSWSPITMFSNNIGYMSEPVKNAFKNAVEEGRNGKGSIYVFSAGNSGQFNGTCGYNEYMTSIYTIGISVVTGKNEKSRQDERCSSITAVTYARDNSMGINYPYDLMPSCGNKNTCVKTTGASSAATALASGIFALVLQANPNLGWRDLQHLIARSSCSRFTSVPWKTNKAGIRVSDDFGFGLLDADALTTNAMSWTNVGQQHECIIAHNTPEPIDRVNTIKKSLDFTAWPASCGGEAKRINYLEHVVLQLSLNFTFRRNIEVEVTSPGGTKSVILRSGRRFDVKQEMKNLSTMSLHFWGEDPRGNWGITLRNVNPDTQQNGTLYNWAFKLYGTTADPMAGNRIVESQIMKNVSNTASPMTTKPCVKKNSQPCGTISMAASSTMVVLLMTIVIWIISTG